MESGLVHHGELILEERAAQSRKRRLKGRFPYGSRAVLSDGGKTGRPQKEEFAPRAFGYRVEREGEDIHLLIGHSYDRPIASRGAGSLSLRDGDDALTFEAMIDEETQQISWVQDFFRAFNAGLIRGISPGFRLPPPRAVAKPEAVTEEDPSEGTALIRTIFAALLYELSMVTRPAYNETEVEAEERSAGGVILPTRHGLHHSSRWR
jgi:hypothetical protein